MSFDSTRKLTLVSSSFSSRAAICREVVNLPSCPAKGDVFGPIAIWSVGASISMTGKASGLSASASVSPMCASATPVICTISPASASVISTRPKPSDTKILSTFAFVSLPSTSMRVMVSPARTWPRWIRPIAYLPWYVSQASEVTSIWNGLSASTRGAGMWSIIASKIGVKSPSVVAGFVGISVHALPSRPIA